MARAITNKTLGPGAKIIIIAATMYSANREGMTIGQIVVRVAAQHVRGIVVPRPGCATPLEHAKSERERVGSCACGAIPIDYGCIYRMDT